MIRRGDYICQYDEEDGLWYVQQIALLDYGRFKDREVAIRSGLTSSKSTRIFMSIK